jgi:hypothetical protein
MMPVPALSFNQNNQGLSQGLMGNAPHFGGSGTSVSIGAFGLPVVKTVMPVATPDQGNRGNAMIGPQFPSTFEESKRAKKRKNFEQLTSKNQEAKRRNPYWGGNGYSQGINSGDFRGNPRGDNLSSAFPPNNLGLSCRNKNASPRNKNWGGGAGRGRFADNKQDWVDNSSGTNWIPKGNNKKRRGKSPEAQQSNAAYSAGGAYNDGNSYQDGSNFTLPPLSGAGKESNNFRSYGGWDAGSSYSNYQGNVSGDGQASYSGGQEANYCAGSAPAFNSGAGPSYNSGPRPSFNASSGPSFNPGLGINYNPGYDWTGSINQRNAISGLGSISDATTAASAYGGTEPYASDTAGAAKSYASGSNSYWA